MNVSGKAVCALSFALAVVVFPVAAMADNSSTNAITWLNTGATISFVDNTFSLSSTVYSITLPNGTTTTGDLGSLSLTAGSLVSGSTSLANGCVGPSGCSFSFADSSFTISAGAHSWTGEVTPNTNVVLAGTCVRSVCSYSLTAFLSSSNGQQVGYTILNFTTNGKFTGGSLTTARAGGMTNVTVPEPGTLGLLGVGLFCLAGVLKRKQVRS